LSEQRPQELKAHTDRRFVGSNMAVRASRSRREPACSEEIPTLPDGKATTTTDRKNSPDSIRRGVAHLAVRQVKVPHPVLSISPTDIPVVPSSPPFMSDRVCVRKICGDDAIRVN
jgi:hypothetical protein